MVEAKVAICRAKNYQAEQVQKALRKCLELLGGLEKFFNPRRKIFVKINHLSPSSPPDRGIITHPGFTREILCLLKDLEMDITVGDDIQSVKGDGFSISGYRQLCQELGVRLVNLKETGFRETTCRGKLLKKVFVSPLLLETDYILNLPKLKTHSYTIFTGAVKNLFGVIPHGLRLQYHRQFPRNELFSEMLVDIFSCVPPHMNIMDAIMAMEGEGPSAGNLRNLGLVLASPDAFALDAVAAKIIGLRPMTVLTTSFGHERSLGKGSLQDISIFGEKVEDVEVKDFRHSAIAVGFLRRKIPSFLYSYLQERLVFIPEVSPGKCTSCLECLNICPRRAIDLHKGKARIHKDACIHCMCCHEVCRFQAIKLKQLFLGKAIRGSAALYRRVQGFIASSKS